MGTTRLLEREDLLRRLHEHAGASRRGSGRLVFIGGEAGAGKTSLVERFRRDLATGTEVMWGACEPMAAPTPLGPLLDFANELVEDAEEMVGWRARRYRLFNSVLASLKTAPHHRLLVFEDLHWADEATIDLLRFLSRRIADAPVLLIGTYRDDELGPDHVLRQLLGDVAAAGAVFRLTVPPLSVAAVRDLASELNIDPVELHQRSKGNPFFVTEVVAAGGERLPEKVGDAVAARISRLSPAGRRALELASVFLKHELDADSLSAMVEDPAAIDECIGRGLLVGDGRALAFRHDLVREAVEGSLPLGKRSKAHAAVLASREDGGAAVPPVGGRASRRDTLAALAHHATEAGDGQAVLRYATAAGQLAMKYQANREARIQFSRALRYAESLPQEERAGLFQDLAKVCCVTGNFAESIGLHHTAIELWRSTGRGAPAAENLYMLAQALFYLGRVEEYWQALAEAEEIVENTAIGTASVDGSLGSGRRVVDAPIDAAPGDEARAATERSQLLETKLKLYLARGESAYPDVAAVERWAAKCEACYQEYGTPRALAVMHRLTASGHSAKGRHRAAVRSTEACIEIAKAHDYDDLIGTSPLTLAWRLGTENRYKLSVPGLQDVVEVARNWDADYLLTQAEALLAAAHLYLGAWQQAEETARNMLNRPMAAVNSRARALIVIGRLRVRRGELDAAEPLGEADDIIERLGKGTMWVQLASVRAEAALAAGEPELALEIASRRLELLDFAAPPNLVAELAYWRWKAGGEASAPEGASGPFAWQLTGRSAAAARRWQRLACPYEQALALVEVGGVEQLRQAHAIFAELGAKPAAAQAAERLRRLGIDVSPRRPAANPTGLTPRERQVLELMRRGLRNNEIAQANKVSPRTVDHQVSAVLAKLGARSRTEAVTLADSLGILAE